MEYVSTWGPLPIVDALPLAILVLSDAGAEHVETLQGRLVKLRTAPTPPALRLDSGCGPQAELLVAMLDGPLTRLAKYASRANAELLEVKRERDELFENFRALEDAFTAQSMSAVTCVFEHTPYADPHDEAIGDLIRGGVSQRLPTASTGVAGFALHFRNPGMAECPLRILLSIIETETPVGEWVAEPDDLHPGWNYFALPRALPVRAHSLMLTLRSEGERPPEPSLGFFLAQPEFAASADGGAECDQLDRRPLAFRIYAGVPGVRPDGELALIAATPASGAAASHAVRLSERVLASAEMVTPCVADVGHDLVAYLRDQKAVVCHPQLGGPTVAALRDALPPNALWVQARAWIAHPRGKPTYVALWAADSGTAPAAQLSAMPSLDQRPTPGFSGWMRVEGPEVSLHLQLPEDYAGGSLLLISLPAERQVDFSWLRFKDFQVARRLRPDNC